MLSLTLNQGDYLTIGSDIVVQLRRVSGDRCRVTVQAPQELPILRGEVLERTGGERPDCVFDNSRWYKPEIAWNRSKEQALTAMRLLLSQMDGRDDGVKALRRQLDHIFPPERTESGPEGHPGPKPTVSNG